MQGAPQPAAGSRPPGGDRLLAELRRALDEGRIDRDDLERLIAAAGPPAGRPRATRVLEALGAAVVALGAALAYATAFADMPDAAQLLTPFAFPAAAFAAFALLARRGRPAWELEVAACTALAALAVAIAAAWAGADHVAPDRWAAGGSLVVAVAAAALARRPPGLAAGAVGLAMAAIAGADALASVAGLEGAGFAWLQLGLGAAALAAGAAALARRPRLAGLLLGAGVVLVAVGALIGVVGDGGDVEGLGGWHVLLSLTVAAAVVLAATLRMPALLAAAAGAGLLWLMLVIPVAGGSAGWALAVVAMGAGLALLGVLAARLGDRRR
ncbi:DUF2157 domain-containing protein [Miltoncostaea marina]|uniref:DUF2157 domain-containing protein n=1 Tax=Miltoncostaea marina TaxID=2843215 RepID=UPI001C3E55CB|nr:DUF2157 domain-containing protein [Miltoncostaea marina]